MQQSWLLFPLVLGCSSARQPTASEATPGVVFPLHFAEGHGDGALGAPLPSASGAPAGSSAAGAPALASASAGPAPSGVVPPAPRPAADPPDPTPLRQADQFEYTFRYERGAVSLVAVRAVRFKQPVVSARRIGRFAFELWIGRELVDRVRFDFPLLAADEPPAPGAHPLRAPPRVTAGPLYARVLVPAAERARRARLVDRATHDEVELAWPPAPAQPGLLDASVAAGAATSTLPPRASAPGALASSTPGASATPPSSSAPGAAGPAR